MHNLLSLLERFGLSQKDASIYLALLELGEGTVIDIAKKANLKRTTVYNLLPELVSQGLVSKTIRAKKRFFYIEDVRQLRTALDQKETLLSEMMPELRARHNLLPQKPRITYYEGMGGMRELYLDTLTGSPGSEIMSYTGNAELYQLMPREFVRFYIETRVKRKIKIRVLASDSDVAREWKRDAHKELRDIRIIPKLPFYFNADTEIYGNKVALISYRENFMGVIIESEDISNMNRTAFEIMWEGLGRGDPVAQSVRSRGVRHVGECPPEASA